MSRQAIRVASVVLCLYVIVACVALAFTGCASVTVRGEAMTAVETSAMDAYQAVARAKADPATPAWEKSYLAENYKQWRSFVRSAKKDAAWGPKLEGE